jgi:hypothetical protein
MKLVNKTGYLKGAKTAKNPVNIIPSSLITTQGMAFPIKANGKTLYPNTGQYKFPTSPVVETPLKQDYQKGTNFIKRLGKVYDVAKPYVSKAYNKSFDFLYKNVPAIDKFLVPKPLDRAKKDLDIFTKSPANKKKIQAMRPNQNTVKLSHSEPMYWDTKKAENRYKEIKQNEPDEFKDNSINEFLYNRFGVNRKGVNPGSYGAYSTSTKPGSINDISLVNPKLNKSDQYYSAVHESGHSRSMRQKVTPEERKILDKAWKPLRDRASNDKIDPREAEAVQHELRMRLKDKEGKKIYSDKDIPKIKKAISKFDKEKHPYIPNPNKFDYKAVVESLNKIGFAGVTGVLLNQNMQEKKNGAKTIKYKEGSKGVSLAFSRGEKDPKGGLTQKGVDKYNRATGGNLKMAVTTPPSKLKAGSKAANRRKSFCARMSGVKGPMAKNGKPTRKALALRKWNC